MNYNDDEFPPLLLKDGDEVDVCVIGLGTVGLPVFASILRGMDSCDKNLTFNVYAVDISEEALIKTREYMSKIDVDFTSGKINVFMGKRIVQSDVYIVATYTAQSIHDIVTKEIPKINEDKDSLIIIESTISPSLIENDERISNADLPSWWEINNPKIGLVNFPHRLVPYDMERYGPFGMIRVIGGINQDSVNVAKYFYCDVLGVVDETMLHETSFLTSMVCKPLENAYRYIEISLAETLKYMFEQYKSNGGKFEFDFEEIRQAMNSKWNIDVKEPRDGIGGECLPKDALFCKELFDNFVSSEQNIFARSMLDDENYRNRFDS